MTAKPLAAGLECCNLRVSRGASDQAERVILEDLSVQFPAGQLSLITGKIGTGKTTLLHVLALLLRPSAGEILADGEAVSRYTAAHRDRWRRRLGMAFQGSLFFDALTVLENVAMPLVPRVASLREASARALDELERLALGHLAERRLAGLSGGERQRIGLARAMVTRPRYLLVDEATAQQDDESAQLIIGCLTDEARAGATLVVVSHDARLRDASVADAVWHLREGRLEAS